MFLLYCQLKSSVCIREFLTLLQNIAKKDEGDPQKSDDEAEKKAGSGEEEDQIEEEGIDEEDIEEVGLCMRTLKCYC